MKQVFFFTFLLLNVISTQVVAQDVPIFAKGEKAANVHHTGDVWLNELNAADSIFNYSIAVATFAPGAKLDWHIHPGGQILLITEGIGYYQEKGKPRRTVKKGDLIRCLPGIEHWHGASQQSGFAYIATSPALKGKTIWLQKLTEMEYSGQ